MHTLYIQAHTLVLYNRQPLRNLNTVPMPTHTDEGGHGKGQTQQGNHLTEGYNQ